MPFNAVIFHDVNYSLHKVCYINMLKCKSCFSYKNKSFEAMVHT
jgi:hypothetical protein